MGLAVVAFFFVPWLDRAKVKSIRYRGWLYKAFLAAFAVSFVVALAVVHWLLRYVASHDFRAFGWYRIGAALLTAGLLVGGVITNAK